MTKMFTEDSDILLVQFRKILTLGETWLIEELCRTVIEAGIIVLLNNKTTMSSWDEEEQKLSTMIQHLQYTIYHHIDLNRMFVGSIWNKHKYTITPWKAQFNLNNDH